MVKNHPAYLISWFRTKALCARGEAGPLPLSLLSVTTRKAGLASPWRLLVEGRLWRMAVVGAVLIAATIACSADPKPDTQLYRRDMSNGIHDTAPVRLVRGALRMHRADGESKCSVCHDGYSANQDAAALQGAHQDLTFDHGLNLFCLNCHNPTNSDAYVYHDGSEIPSDEPTRLCAKCHGPHYRDYLLGVHGRVNGYWDPNLGTQTKLDCIQCHDPHRPKFQPIEPDPPPVLARFSIDSQGL